MNRQAIIVMRLFPLNKSMNAIICNAITLLQLGQHAVSVEVSQVVSSNVLDRLASK